MSNTGDAGQVAKAAKLEKARSIEHEKDIKDLLATPAFRRVIWTWLVEMLTYSSTFAGELSHVSAYQNGQQDFGKRIREQLESVDEEKYNLMRHEARLRTETDEKPKKEIEAKQPKENEDD